MSDSEDPIDPIDEDGDDLFGDEGDEGDNVASPTEQILDDDDLASDPEGETYARNRDDDDAPQHVETLRRIMDASAYRHPIPKPTDGVVSTQSAYCLPGIHLTPVTLVKNPARTQIRQISPRGVSSRLLHAVRFRH